MTRLLIVERPGEFRDALSLAASARGDQVQTCDDAMDALSALDAVHAFGPTVVLVSEDPGAPGAGSLCRILRRRLGELSVVRLGEPTDRDPLDHESTRMSRTLGVDAVARALLAEPGSVTAAAHAFQLSLGARGLPALLIAISERFLSGRLVLAYDGAEREIFFVRGLPVFARSSHFSERLGFVLVSAGLASADAVARALELGRSRELRLGEALLAGDSLTGTQLFSGLAAQLVLQLSSACNDAACHASFVMDAPAAALLLRCSPMTAIVAACDALSEDELQRELSALGDAALPFATLSRTIERFLRDLGLTDLPAPALGADALRTQLREALARTAGLSAHKADAITLALYRAGSDPLDASSLRALAPVQSEHDRVVDDYVHGARTPELARELALRGPAADARDAHAELLAAYARATSGGLRGLFSAETLGAGDELRFEALALRKHVEVLAHELSDPLARYAALAVREQLERELSKYVEAPLEPPAAALVLPAAVQVPTKISLAPPPSAARTVPSKAPPPPPAPPPARVSLAPERPRDAGLSALPEVTPLLAHGKWHELRALLAARYPDLGSLPPTLALLYAIAHKEEPPSDDLEQKRFDADALGIRAMGQLLGVPEHDTTALLLAKRMLRRRPLEWNQKPPARISLLLVVIALVIGAGAGFFISPSLVHFLWK